jgi:hypothetical protein
MVVCLDSPLVIENILKVLVGLILFFLDLDGYLAKILSTFIGISICTFTRFVPLGIYGLDLILAIV